MQFDHFFSKVNYPDSFYFFDLDKVKNRAKIFKETWESFFPNVKFYFSIKTNNNREVLDALCKMNYGAEVVTNNEFELAKEIGFHRILFNGVNKSIETIVKVVESDGLVLVDSEVELYSLFEGGILHDIQSNLGFRLSITNVHGNQSIFGIPIEKIIPLLEALESSNILISKIGIHCGSNINNPDIFLNALSEISSILFFLSSKFNGVVQLSIGGGLCSNHSLGNPLDEDDLVNNWKIIAKSILKFMNHLELDENKFSLILEPGRSIVEDAGYIITSVKEIIKEKNIVRLDIGNNYIPSSNYRHHDLIFINKKTSSTDEVYTIVGNLCYETDIIKEKVFLPKDLMIGDRVVITGIGAYDYTTSYQWGRDILSVYYLLDNKFH